MKTVVKPKIDLSWKESCPKLSNRILVCAVMLLVITAASVVNPLGAISSVSAAPLKPLYGGIFRIAYQSDPRNLNPLIESFAPAGRVQVNIYNRLFHYDPNTFEFVPELATSWEISPDGTSYTFHLARNVTWHDGVPFTSADVKWHYLTVLDMPTPTRGFLKPVLVSIETPDNYTVQFRFKQIVLQYLLINGGESLILPKHLYEGTDVRTNPYNTKPIGTGPFKFVEWKRDDYIILAANDKYWQGRPYLDRVVFKFIPKAELAAIAFEKGEIDAIEEPLGVPFHDIPRFRAMQGVAVFTWPAVSPVKLQFNDRPEAKAKYPWSNNKLVREAIAHAIDKKTFIDKVLFNIVEENPSPVPFTVKWAYNPNVPKWDYDLDKANKLLDDAGYPRGADGIRFKAPMPVPDYGTFASDAEFVKESLRKVGIDVTILVSESSAYFGSYLTNPQGLRDYPITYYFGTAAPDPDVIRRLYDSGMVPPMGSNFSWYNNSRVDYLFDQASKTNDLKKRAQYYMELQNLIVKDLTYIFLYMQANVEVVRVSDFMDLDKSARPITWYAGYRSVWYTKGSEVSPEGVAAKITSVETELAKLRGQYYDTTAASKRLGEAKQALQAGDYLKAYQLANEAIALAEPPYAIYGSVALLAIVMVVAALYIRRKRRREAED